MIKLEIVYIAADKSVVQIHSTLAEGTTVAQALEHSNIWIIHPETEHLSVGVFSKKVPLDTVLKDGDRLEIYRPLPLNPGDKRRERAKLKKKSPRSRVIRGDVQ